jgi:hypothetical protein
MAKQTKQVRIWEELDIKTLAEKMSMEKGIEISYTEAVSIAIQEALEKREDVMSITEAIAEMNANA